jgi:hypothetical protein
MTMVRPYSYCIKLKTHFGSFTRLFSIFDFKSRNSRKTKYVGYDISGKYFDIGIKLIGCRIEKPACRCKFILNIRKFGLKLKKIRITLEFRIGLRKSKNRF